MIIVEAELTPEQKIKIYETIGRHMAPDDRYPSEVIEDRYDGNEEAYLKAMARWHNVKLD